MIAAIPLLKSCALNRFIGSLRSKETVRLPYRLYMRNPIIHRMNIGPKTNKCSSKKTLLGAETGILFVGLAHEVKKLLEKEMKVTEPEALIGSSSETLRNRFIKKEREQ